MRKMKKVLFFFFLFFVAGCDKKNNNGDAIADAIAEATECPPFLPPLVFTEEEEGSCTLNFSAAYVHGASSGFLTGEIVGSWQPEDGIPISDENGDGFLSVSFLPGELTGGVFSIYFVGDRGDGEYFWPFFNNFEILSRVKEETRQWIFCEENSMIAGEPNCGILVQVVSDETECRILPAGNMGNFPSAVEDKNGQICVSYLSDPILLNEENCSVEFSADYNINAVALELNDQCDDSEDNGFIFNLAGGRQYLDIHPRDGCGGEQASFWNVASNPLFIPYLRPSIRRFISCWWFSPGEEPTTPLGFCRYRVKVNLTEDTCQINPAGNMRSWPI